MYRIGIDIGGTFTDFTVVSDDGKIELWKEDSTPWAPHLGVEAGLEQVAENLGMDLAGLLSRTELLVHGTTIATNTLIQRNGPRVGLICTRGFRDVLLLRNAHKPDRFNTHLPFPKELVDRADRIPVTERITSDGEVETPIEVEEIRRAAAHFREAEVKAVGVSFLWSIVNDEHERTAAEILAEELPGVHVVTSSEVLPEIREWQRTSATAMGAYVLPAVHAYLSQLQERLAAADLKRPILIMQSNGGCAAIADVLRNPVQLVASGPAAAPAAAHHHASKFGFEDVIVTDMGGTSFDVGLVHDGAASMSRDIEIAGQPIGVAAVEIDSVGAGGGSIGWVDSGGALRVGPESAGSTPGPAAYGKGGTRPTVTDANLVLGRLAPAAFLGGRRELDLEAATRAVQTHVGDRLGMDATAAAWGMSEVVEARMVAAIRDVSVRRGHDPRHFAVVAGGGAGGLHAASLARQLEIRDLIVPLEAGALCAFGMTVTDVRMDALTAHHADSDSVDFKAVNQIFGDLEDQLLARAEAQGFAAEEVTSIRSVDVRYPGQVHDLTVPVPAGEFGPEALAAVLGSFHSDHESRFTYSRPELPVEFRHWRVALIKSVAPRYAESGGESSQATPSGERDVVMDGRPVPTSIYDARELRPGAEIAGPAVIEAPTTTIVLNPNDLLTVDSGAYRVAIGISSDKNNQEKRSIA